MMMKIKTYLGLPVILLHEFSHILFGIFSGYFYDFKESRFGYDENGEITCLLMPKSRTRNLFQIWMGSLAPLWMLIILLLIGLFIWTPLLLVFIYIAFYLDYALPSETDMMYVKYSKAFTKYDLDHPVLEKFINIKRPGFIETTDGIECPEI